MTEFSAPPHGHRGGAARRRAARPLVERVAGWSTRHRFLAIAGWVALVAGAVATSALVGSSSLNSYDPGQAGQAERALARTSVVRPAAEAVLIQARTGGTVAGDPTIRQAIAQVAGALRRMPAVAADVRTPLSPGGRVTPHGAALISRDGRSALVTFDVAGNPNNADTTVAAAQRAVAAVAARHPGLTVVESGDASVGRALSGTFGTDFRRAELTSVPITLVLLLVVFGALIAAGIPLLLAGTAVITAISLLAVPSHWVPIGQTTSSVVLLIGMAVGIDYSLFYLRREREEKAAGASQRTALATAAATSGRAIVVSGLTVMISLAGLFLTGIDVFSGIAIGTIVVVGVAVIGSLTVLPATLSALGKWVDRPRIPFLGRRRTTARRSRLWEALACRVVARPVLAGGLAALALAALATPALTMRLASPGLHDLPPSVPVVRNLLLTQRAFPGGQQPEEVVVTGARLASPAMRGAVTGLARAAAASPALRQPVTTSLLGHGQVLVINVPLAGDGTDATSAHALTVLRDRVLPATLGHVRGVSYAVTGVTASDRDFNTRLASRAPLVVLFVAGLAFLLLMLTFRSVTIPLMSIALNLLSVGAAYGLVTLVFQHGLLAGPLGFSPYGGVVTWLPLFMFVMLFGLSMDYHVFILSRVRELWARGSSARDAISGGIGASAGVVTSAAVIMVAVFSIFATLSVMEFKMFGVGMASAVLIDATVVRGVLMPAALSLLGERAWYLPNWLSWLPGGGRRVQPGDAGERLLSQPVRA